MSARSPETHFGDGRRFMALRRLLASQVAVVVAAATMFSGVAAQPVVAAAPLHTNVIDVHGLSFPPTTSYCLANFGIHCYSPAQFEKAYDLGPLHSHGIDGRGQTIAIVDSFGSPTIANDLHVFDQTFGLPDPPSLKIIAPAGPIPAFDPTNSDMVGWAEETTLDVEWSHVFAPGANILLVETPVSETEGVHGLPGDRQGRELRDQPRHGRRDLAELRRDGEHVPQQGLAAEPAERLLQRAIPRSDGPGRLRRRRAPPTSS